MIAALPLSPSSATHQAPSPAPFTTLLSTFSSMAPLQCICRPAVQPRRKDGTGRQPRAIHGERPRPCPLAFPQRSVLAPRSNRFPASSRLKQRGRPPQVEIPPYNPLNDPALADYFARKFAWDSTAPAPAAPRRRRTVPARHSSTQRSGTAKASTGSSSLTLRIHTSKKSSPVSKSSKYITVIGSKGRSDRILLAAPGVHFKAGTTDTFTLPLAHVGKPIKVSARRPPPPPPLPLLATAQEGKGLSACAVARRCWRTRAIGNLTLGGSPSSPSKRAKAARRCSTAPPRPFG